MRAGQLNITSGNFDDLCIKLEGFIMEHGNNLSPTFLRDSILRHAKVDNKLHRNLKFVRRIRNKDGNLHNAVKVLAAGFLHEKYGKSVCIIYPDGSRVVCWLGAEYGNMLELLKTRE